MKFWTSTGVKCPFYAGENGRVIHCDVPSDPEPLRIHVWFEDGERKAAHKARLCKSAILCVNCPIYSAAAKGDK